ncbi:MAG: MFS transporter [Anaerolineales bacterium]
MNQYRNVAVLSFGQVLGLTGAVMGVFIGGIIGSELAPTPVLATLPITASVVGVASFPIPASLLMKRIGRRRGFQSAAFMACLAALLAAYAIHLGNFALYALALFFIGGNSAFIQQYRFAAVESVTPEISGRAVSLVLLGGVAGGLIGPELARRTKDILPFGEYTGSYAALALIYLALILLMAFLARIQIPEKVATGEERPMRLIVVQPGYIVAVIASVVAYAVMSLIMTATPISMHSIHGHSLAATGLVIQSHVVAMYLPSLITASVITRLGYRQVMASGVLLIGLCIGLNLLGTQVINYWAALVLLGIGWNFLFIGGTVMLSENYRPAERFKAQAFNDFSIFGVQAIASLSAGTLIFLTSWQFLNAIALPVLVLMLMLILFAQRRSKRLPAPAQQ